MNSYAYYPLYFSLMAALFLKLSLSQCSDYCLCSNYIFNEGASSSSCLNDCECNTTRKCLGGSCNDCEALGVCPTARFACSPGTFQTSSSDLNCYSCDPACSSCSSTSTNCTSCANGLFLQNSQCVSECTGGLFAIETTKTCESQCEPQYFHLINRCYQVCPDGYFGEVWTQTCMSTCPSYDFGDLITKRCEYCYFDCRTCETTSTNCTSCKYDWLEGDQCSHPSCKFFKK